MYNLSTNEWLLIIFLTFYGAIALLAFYVCFKKMFKKKQRPILKLIKGGKDGKSR